MTVERTVEIRSVLLVILSVGSLIITELCIKRTGTLLYPLLQSGDGLRLPLQIHRHHACHLPTSCFGSLKRVRQMLHRCVVLLHGFLILFPTFTGYPISTLFRLDTSGYRLREFARQDVLSGKLRDIDNSIDKERFSLFCHVHRRCGKAPVEERAMAT